MVSFSYGLREKQKFKRMASFCYGRTLDVGCARNPNPFLPAPVTGLDIRPFREWRELPDNYVRRVRGDVARMRFRKEFDCIVASEVVEHLRDPIKFLECCHAALKSGGLLVLSTDNPYRFQTLAANAFFPSGIGASSDFKAKDLGHINFFLPRMLNVLATEAGFSVVSVECGEGLPLPFLQQKLIYVYRKKA